MESVLTQNNWNFCKKNEVVERTQVAQSSKMNAKNIRVL